MAAKSKGGRPPEPVPQDIADEVVEWISSGQTLRDYCRQDGKPARRTIDKWREKDETFRARFARARDDGFDVIAEECMAIADDGENDWMAREGKDGDQGWQLNGEHVQRTKVRIETRLKLLAKWDPKRYGERQTVEHEGKLTLAQLVEASYSKPEPKE